MRTITIANRKGGVGKTATAHAVGAGLSLRGYKTLFIDLDSQCNLSYELGADEEAEATSMEVLTGEATAEEAIQHTEGGDIIAGSPYLATADKELEGAYRLRDALEPIAGEYDYCIIDTPPALGILAINALTASNSVIIPAKAGVHSLKGLKLLHDTISLVQEMTNPDLKIEGIVVTLYKGRTILARDMRENLEEDAKQLNTKVFNTPIRDNTAIAEAQAMQRDIFSYSPRSNGAHDYNALIDEIERGGKA